MDKFVIRSNKSNDSPPEVQEALPPKPPVPAILDTSYDQGKNSSVLGYFKSYTLRHRSHELGIGFILTLICYKRYFLLKYLFSDFCLVYMKKTN